MLNSYPSYHGHHRKLVGRWLHFRWVSLITLALLPAALYCAAASTPAATPTAHYSFAVVPQFEQRKLFKVWRPILDELERRTGLRFELIGTPKIPAFEREFMRGAFDFVYMNPYHVVIGHRSQGYVPLVRDGVRQLTGILVVRKDSPIRSLKELEGGTIAFPSPNALGASLLPRVDLIQAGVHFVPRYVQTHTSVYLHVAKGLTDAGGGVRSTLALQDPPVREAVRVLHETRSLTPHPVCAHPRVPVAHRELIKQVLLDMGANARGRALLAPVPMEKVVPAFIEDYRAITDWQLERMYLPQ